MYHSKNQRNKNHLIEHVFLYQNPLRNSWALHIYNFMTIFVQVTVISYVIVTFDPIFETMHHSKNQRNKNHLNQPRNNWAVQILQFMTIFVQLLGYKIVNLCTLHNKSTNKTHSSVSKEFVFLLRAEMWFNQNQNLNYQQWRTQDLLFWGWAIINFPQKLLSKVVKQKLKTNQTNKLYTLEGLRSIP